MRKKIRVIVYAKTEEEASEKAETIFNQLCGEDKDLDYFHNTGKPILASSKTGQKLINDAWELTKKEFKENLTKLRKAFNEKSDDEIFNDTQTRFIFYLTGQLDAGYTLWLYNDEGEGISTKDQLNDTLNKENLYKDDKIWVITTYVHY